MKELLDYREKMIARLKQTAEEFCHLCAQVPDAYAPLAEGEWNVHQIASHVHNTNQEVYELRARRTVEEDRPTFQNYDGDAWMAESYDSKKPLRLMLDSFYAQVSSFADWLKTLPVAAWSRESQHETLGSGFTTQLWVERGLAHIEEHLDSVRKAV